MKKIDEHNNAELKIREVNASNVEQAMGVAIRVFGEVDRDSIEKEFKASVGDAPNRDAVSKILGIDMLKFFIAYKHGKPAGVTGYYTIAGHEEDAWLGWIGVLDDFKNQGIGRRLVTEAFNQAARDLPGIKTLRIWTTLEADFDRARELYDGMGFTEELYKPSATDAASMVVVFSKGAAPNEENFARWRNASYRVDCEAYVIPDLNQKLGLGPDAELDKANNPIHRWWAGEPYRSHLRLAI